MEKSKGWPSIAAMANDITKKHQSNSKIITGIRHDLNRLISILEKQGEQFEKQNKLISKAIEHLQVLAGGSL